MDDDYGFFSLFRQRIIPHYYGDQVRQLLVAAAVISIIVIPLWGDLLPFGTPVEVLGAIILVLLAGLTNPHGKTIFFFNAAIAAIGVFLLEVVVIATYASQSFYLSASREVIALMLVFAFYYSVKTLRAMAQGKVGKDESAFEFEDLEKRR